MSDNVKQTDIRDSAQSEDDTSKPYTLDVATNVVPMQRDHLGRPYWESYQTPDSYKVHAEARVPPHLPGVIIFVHGVNSEGEWYHAAEEALCDGLNDRLGRLDLKANTYTDNDGKGGLFARQIKSMERSPVIRFYWGYSAKPGEERKWRVPLRNIDGADQWKDVDATKNGPWYWGGGPFQNGTNNLQQLWSEKGFDVHLLGIFNMQWFNTEWDRELHDAPGRQYYAHAAQRLADLIDTIRTRNPQDTITVMSHSQGTMIAMAATLMCKQRAPDSLVAMNSPFALQDKTTDALTCWHDRPTEQARINTFCNVANRIKQSKKTFTAEERQLLHVGATPEMELWHADVVNNGVPERDNHGRLYVYFNPHDRVMGAEPLQSIGWQGVDDKVLAGLGDTVKQRMLARGTSCGDDPNPKTKFGSLPPIPNPADKDVKPDDFWNGNRRVMGMQLWHVPNKNQTVNINAEKVPHPITAQEMSQHYPRAVTLVKDGQMLTETVDRYFDESRADQDALGARDAKGNYRDSTVPYLEAVHDREKAMMVPDLYASSGRRTRLETEDEMLNRIEDYQPMPTNHSTLPQHQPFMRRVAAWDLPIGFCDSYESPDFWISLMRQADWTQFTDPYFGDGTFQLAALPDGVDPETVEQEITEAQRAQLKLGYTS